jgi:hypothetical protein
LDGVKIQKRVQGDYARSCMLQLTGSILADKCGGFSAIRALVGNEHGLVMVEKRGNTTSRLKVNGFVERN